MNTYKLTLIAMLAALAVAGRFMLAGLPNIQPVTAIIILTGFWMGPLAAVCVAALTTFLSNVLLGMGPWVVWQGTAWILIGAGAGLLGHYRAHVPFWGLSIYGAMSGFFFGLVLSLTMRAAGQPFWGYYLAGLPFDGYHALSNAGFILVLAPLVQRLFFRYQNQYLTI
ncbi:ECF transporter S component [Thalassobacillus sp. CUG 92003]|uniref:ECF transporter S component n=1 Tax=Thalassobacillus sp. CUG 92003 TaxID=2736641 RepID=UPI0015E6ACC2|nr:ECF transporter S component [Thalassobacillus sp. CUG 92003]